MKKILDGNIACSNVAYMFSQLCSIYPITPSSTMASNASDLESEGVLNIFESTANVVEMQSEAGAAGTMHGALLMGSLTSTFTASQGLLLMLPNMYKMAGEMLPGVMHVAARSLATHSLSIFGDHQDVYSARGTGFCILASSNVFDAQNLAAVSHLSAIEGSLPFMHFFDGFRTSHEINTIDILKKEDIIPLVNFDKIKEYRNRVLSPSKAKEFGLASNEDIYFQNMEVRNNDYNDIADIVNDYMEKINNIMGTNYKPFNYYGASDAKYVVVAMGSVNDTIKEYIDNNSNLSIGLIEVHLYRPFSVKYLFDILPNTVTSIAVLDRTKEAGSIGEPLYLDIVAALANNDIKIYGGRYGLSSKNVDPSHINDIYNMLINKPYHNFTVGIEDDVTNLSVEHIDYKYSDDSLNIKIYGFGSDGMVSASKDILKLINKKEESYVQGYFEYDSKKSGGVTVSNLRISDKVINKPYYVDKSDIVVVTLDTYLDKFDVVSSLKDNSILLINSDKDSNVINSMFSRKDRDLLLSRGVETYVIDAGSIARKYSLGSKISKIIEYSIFYLLGKDYIDDMISSIRKIFASKGDDIINNNIKAMEHAIDNLSVLKIDTSVESLNNNVNNNIYECINSRCGNCLKVSDMQCIKDGSFVGGLSKGEKRCVSSRVPVWNKDACIECGKCSFVCPHAVIRPFIGDFPEGKEYMNDKSKKYVIKVSSEDCTGCSLCASVCPGKNGVKALVMDELGEYEDVRDLFDNHVNDSNLPISTVKGSQFKRPRFEFSGACAGCGEAAYIKVLTQLLGDNLVIANATGCSSIYGGSVPSTPYTIPWANSLFEDNAEFALGMHLSIKEKRNTLKNLIIKYKESPEYNEIFNKLIDNFDNIDVTNYVKSEMEKLNLPSEIGELIDYVPAAVVFAIGGDGWAYDIGYGGLDHVLHSNENIKVLVLDTEAYSNTGGQASKSTRMGAVAEFANLGKRSSKKDLFNIATSIDNCYVASISMGASDMQTLKAYKEAIEHDGPALIIAYSPCIEHGIKSGLVNAIEEQKLAVECGYNMLMRYNPVSDKLSVDSKEPNFDLYSDFLKREVRYNSLSIKDRELFDVLSIKHIDIAKKRYYSYKEKESI